MFQYYTARRIVLFFMILSMIGFPLTGHANCEVTLRWHTSNHYIEGYQVFGREEGQDFDYENPWWQGDSSFRECSIESLDERKTYYFVMRAFAGDNMSADSNEVRYAYGDNGDTVTDGQSGSGCFLDMLIQNKESYPASVRLQAPVPTKVAWSMVGGSSTHRLSRQTNRRS